MNNGQIADHIHAYTLLDAPYMNDMVPILEYHASYPDGRQRVLHPSTAIHRQSSSERPALHELYVLNIHNPLNGFLRHWMPLLEFCHVYTILQYGMMYDAWDGYCNLSPCLLHLPLLLASWILNLGYC